MSWITTYTRLTAVLLVLCVSGCVSAPGYRYVVDDGGDYYYDGRPVGTTTYIQPAFGGLGYGPGGWYGSVGFGFGTYYGLGGYYGPSWGAFGPRYGAAGYWHPPYYYTPRYIRPPHHRPPYQHVRPLPWPHDSSHAWRRHEQNRPHRPSPPKRHPGNRPWPRDNHSLADGARPSNPPAPRIRRAPPRDMAVQMGPDATPQRVQRAIAPSQRPLTRNARATPRIAETTGAPRPLRTTAPGVRTQPLVQPRRSAPHAEVARPASAPPKPQQQARTAPVPPRAAPSSRPPSAPVTRPATPAPRSNATAPRRGGSSTQRQR